jgi:hypothetical protein
MNQWNASKVWGRESELPPDQFEKAYEGFLVTENASGILTKNVFVPPGEGFPYPTSE